MTEFEMIERLKHKLTTHSPRVTKGIGDDTAVLRPGTKPLLFCSDLMIESVHFDLNFARSFDLGHKSLASCFSDLVAMNGTGLAATVSLALPKTTAPEFLDGFYEGLDAFATRAGLECVGGDLSSSPNLIFIDVACVGESAHPIYRSGAKPGDRLVVSGTPGASAAGLSELKAFGRTSELLSQKHLRPEPRFDLLPSLGAFTSLIDISDGVASEVAHLAKASGVGFIVEANLLPLHHDAVAAAQRLATSPIDWALYGGEDYELLGTLPSQVAVPPGFTVIGRATESLDLTLRFLDESEVRLSPRGFDHFRR